MPGYFLANAAVIFSLSATLSEVYQTTCFSLLAASYQLLAIALPDCNGVVAIARTAKAKSRVKICGRDALKIMVHLLASFSKRGEKKLPNVAWLSFHSGELFASGVRSKFVSSVMDCSSSKRIT